MRIIGYAPEICMGFSINILVSILSKCHQISFKLCFCLGILSFSCTFHLKDYFQCEESSCSDTKTAKRRLASPPNSSFFLMISRTLMWCHVSCHVPTDLKFLLVPELCSCLFKFSRTLGEFDSIIMILYRSV